MNSHELTLFLLELQCERRHYSLQPKHIRRYDKHCALSMGKAWKGPTDGWLLLGSPTMLISPSQLENDLATEACNLRRQKIPRETAMGRCSKSMPPLQQHSTHSTAVTPHIPPYYHKMMWCSHHNITRLSQAQLEARWRQANSKALQVHLCGLWSLGPQITGQLWHHGQLSLRFHTLCNPFILHTAWYFRICHMSWLLARFFLFSHSFAFYIFWLDKALAVHSALILLQAGRGGIDRVDGHC